MPPMRVEPNKTISIVEFKSRAARLLPADHALNVILRRVPDRLSAAELAIRLDDWLPLIEEA